MLLFSRTNMRLLLLCCLNLPQMMIKVVLILAGAREHSLAWEALSMCLFWWVRISFLCIMDFSDLSGHVLYPVVWNHSKARPGPRKSSIFRAVDTKKPQLTLPPLRWIWLSIFKPGRKDRFSRMVTEDTLCLSIGVALVFSYAKEGTKPGNT